MERKLIGAQVGVTLMDRKTNGFENKVTDSTKIGAWLGMLPGTRNHGANVFSSGSHGKKSDLRVDHKCIGKMTSRS